MTEITENKLTTYRIAGVLVPPDGRVMLPVGSKIMAVSNHYEGDPAQPELDGNVFIRLHVMMPVMISAMEERYFYQRIEWTGEEKSIKKYTDLELRDGDPEPIFHGVTTPTAYGAVPAYIFEHVHA